MVIDGLLDSNGLLEPLTACDERRTVRIDLSETRQLDLVGDQEQSLFAEGHTAMSRFLADGDVETYRRACRT